jgi:hypothetical protein
VAQAQKIGSALVARALESLSVYARPSPYSLRPSFAWVGLLVLLIAAGNLFLQIPTANWPKIESLISSPSAVVSAQPKEVAPTPKREIQPAPVIKATATAPEGALLKQLLNLWGVKSVNEQDRSLWPLLPNGHPDVRLIAARHGLEVAELSNVNWSDIEAIGLPAVLVWAGEKEPRLLMRFEAKSAFFLAPDGKEERYFLDEMKKKILSSGWILWRNGDGWTQIATAEWTSRMVTLFAARLNSLGYLDYPLPAKYDERFSGAVRKFQRSVGLATDGVLGPRTALILARTGAQQTAPRLSDGGRS